MVDPAKLSELAAAATEAADELGTVRSVLTAIVTAKDSGAPAVDAWTLARELVARWRGEAPTDGPELVRCPGCSALLSNAMHGLTVGGERGAAVPEEIECEGDVHALNYGAYVAEIGEDRRPRLKDGGGRTTLEIRPVWGAEEGDDDADVRG